MLTYKLVQPFNERAKEVDKLLEKQERNKLFIELEKDIETVQAKPCSYPTETIDEVLRAPLMGLFGRNKKLNQQMLVVQYGNAISFLENEIARLCNELQTLKIRNNFFPVDKILADQMEVLEKNIAENTVLLDQHREEMKYEEAKLEEISPSSVKVLEDSYLGEMAKMFF